MESSLYAPGGFYPTRTVKADFYTAPELHPSFGEILAGEVAARLKELSQTGVREPFFIVEMGSGNGTLARRIAKTLRQRHPEWAGRAQFALIERCENLLVESICSFAGTGERILGFTRLEDLPPCAGVFISNELVDAFPVHLLEKRDGKVHEVYVEDEEVLGPLSTPALRPHANMMHLRMSDGARHAVNLEALRWLKLVSTRIKAGTLITIDYGRRLAPGAANEPRSFKRHQVDGQLTAEAGRKDLTASVDFEPLIQEGQKLGLKTVAFESMSRFLIERGILERLPQSAGQSDLEAYKERNQIKTLFHPEGMGETFKVLIQEKRP